MGVGTSHAKRVNSIAATTAMYVVSPRRTPVANVRAEIGVVLAHDAPRTDVLLNPCSPEDVPAIKLRAPP